MEGWLACLFELGIFKDNPAWAKAALAPKFPESLEPYSPLVLPNFDDEEYVNHPEEDDDALDVHVAPGNEAVNPTGEVGRTIAEGSGEKTTKEDGGDATRDPLPKL